MFQDWTTSNYFVAIGGLLGALALWATQVTPEQAVSHASEWTRAFGLRSPPHWLKSENADRIIRHLGGLLLAGCVLFGFFGFFEIGKAEVGLRILFGIGCLGVIGAISWHLFFPNAKLEPIHFIIIGLVVALSGAIWQWRKTPPIDPQITTLQTEIANLRKSLTDTAQPKTSATQLGQPQTDAAPATAPLEPYYSSSDKERIAEALYKLSEVMNKQLAQVVNDSYEILRWWEKNRSNRADQRPDIDQFLARLDGLRKLEVESYRSIYFEGLLKDYQTYSGLLQDILQTPQVEREQPIAAWGIAANNFFDAITTFKAAFSPLDARTREGLVTLINPTRDVFDNATGQLNAWIVLCKQRIEAKRKALRT